jgi:uncharacterized iron-regulated membrane protein
MSVQTLQQSAFYRMVWRWHFYAGLFVIPFIVILSLTGAVYLFKPQVDRWEERAFQNLPTTNAVSPDVQLDAVLAAFPGARFDAYRLPERPGDAAMIHLGLLDGGMTDVFVSPRGRVLGRLDPDDRWIELVREIHSELLGGRIGSWLVETAANWAIVMILTGLYLWWPARRALAGVVWPRLGHGRRAFWRDLHAVTGFWVAGLALVLLVTALPWAGVWGQGFKSLRSQMGWVSEPADWKIGGGEAAHAEHDHEAMMKRQAAGVPMAALGDIVAKAKAEHLAFPVLVRAPSAKMMEWTVKSDAQNRPLRLAIIYDIETGKEVKRNGFSEKHPIDRAVGYGIAWHEGQLFGWLNQLVGVLTALALVTLAVSGLVMWQRRKPADVLGAPPVPHVPARIGGVVVIIGVLALLLPMLAVSLGTILLLEWCVFRRIPRLRQWLGLQPFRTA